MKTPIQKLIKTLSMNGHIEAVELAKNMLNEEKEHLEMAFDSMGTTNYTRVYECPHLEIELKDITDIKSQLKTLCDNDKNYMDVCELTIHFGKNGMGLSDELSIIGKHIEILSSCNQVYLRDSFIDVADDVYFFTFAIYSVIKWDLDENYN